MKISFVLPFNAITGGVRAILELANHLQDLGHHANVYIPFIPYDHGEERLSSSWLIRMARGLGRSLRRGSRIRWTEVRVPIKMVPWVSSRFLSEADIVIATSWPTAYSVARLSPRQGIPLYFIFHYEIDDGPEQLVANSYSKIARRVAISQLSAETIARATGCEIPHIVKLGIDPKVFYPPVSFEREPSLLVYLHSGPRKGGQTALKVIRAVRDRHPTVPINAFGYWAGKPSLPADVRFYSKIDDPTLGTIYRSHSIFVYTSDYEGYGLPPLEAMASGCAVVATRTGAIPDYCEHGRTGLLREPGDVHGLIADTLRLCGSPEERATLGRSASAAVLENLTWDVAAREFAAYLETQVLGGRPRVGDRGVQGP
jgi:glycosyltransferase involved in cell wall biosynthesis